MHAPEPSSASKRAILSEINFGTGDLLEMMRAECEQENDRDRHADEPEQDRTHDKLSVLTRSAM
jgi:hypothetical protein